MKLIFEKSVKGRGLSILPKCDVDGVALSDELSRKSELELPEMSETDISQCEALLAKAWEGNAKTIGLRLLPAGLLHHEVQSAHR